MRTLPKNLLSLCLATIPLLRTVHAVSLSQLQPINGFPPACTVAYNAEIGNCIAADFESQHGCSQACIEGIRNETTILQSACVGVSAPTSELIGRFLAGDGVAALCKALIQTGSSLYTVLSSVEGQNITVFTTITLLSSAALEPTVPESTALPARSTQIHTTTSDASPTTILQSPKSIGLDVEGKIGVGVGIPIGVVMAALVMALLWRRRRKRAQETRVSEQATKKRRKRWQAYLQNKGELDAEEQRRNEMEASEIRREIDGRERHELEAVARRQELVADENVQELAP